MTTNPDEDFNSVETDEYLRTIKGGFKQTVVKIDPQGVIYVNDEVADQDNSDRSVPVLTDRLKRYAASTALAQTEPQIIIDCDDKGKGQRFVDVLNACAKADIKNITLAN